MNFDTFFNEQLDHLKSDGNYRYFAELERKAGKFPHASNQVESEKHDVTVCCSNNYLGMGQNPLTIAAMCEAVQRMGTGAGDTRNISGANHDHLLLEAELADLHGKDAAPFSPPAMSPTGPPCRASGPAFRIVSFCQMQATTPA